MKILKWSLLFVLTIFFIGCGQQPFPGKTIEEASIYHDKNKSSGMQIIRIPNLNIENTVEVGENLYQKLNQISFDTYNVKLLENTQGELFNGGFINTYNLKEAERKNKLLYSWNNKNAMCLEAGHDYNLKRPIKICLVDNENKNYFTHAAYNYKDILYPLKNIAKYKIKDTPPKFNEDSFKYVALYQGKIANKVKISFREFKNNMARPAFTQDIEYELEKDGTGIIGFKGLRIKILKATSTEVTYKVLQDYK